MKQQGTNMQRDVLNMNMEAQLQWIAGTFFGNTLEECTDQQMYYVLQAYCKRLLAVTERNSGDKRVYYISPEFMTGRLLMSDLINLKIYDRIVRLMEKYGKNLRAIEETEPEPGLGHGSLGRLAACYMDSIATQGLPGEGIGLCYHFGCFKQILHSHRQWEVPEPWIEPESWLVPTDITFDVNFADRKVRAKMYDIDAVGYDGCVNKIRLFDLEGTDESLVKDGIAFDKAAVDRNLTLFLYPDDSDEDGKLLRLYQEYFLASCAVQWILTEMKEQQYDLRQMDQHAVIQINDTFPALAIAELVRILTQEKAMPMGEAIRIAKKTFAFTNHEITPQALERWPMTSLQKVVPHLVPIIRELDRRIRRTYPQQGLQIIRDDGMVSMGAMCVHYSFSVNGVVDFYTEAIEHTLMKPYKEIYPEKFNNKADGISLRKWLLEANHPLADYLSEIITDAYKRDAMQLERLLEYRKDPQVLGRLEQIKRGNKLVLVRDIANKEGIVLDPEGIFDIQIKRIHTYKRQYMNLLYAVHRYLEIRRGMIPARPLNMIFGGKTAPDYLTAKDMIHAILVLQELVDRDPEVSRWLKIAFVNNYNVSRAQKLVPACDISEQITLASREASGTTGMKMMLAGALTLGSRDGVTLEIEHLVGRENVYTFGLEPELAAEIINQRSYRPQEYYEQSAAVREAVDFLTSEKMMEMGDPAALQRLREWIIQTDEGMALAELEEYIRVKDRMILDYEDRLGWMEKSLVSIAHAGWFSSDRSVMEYNQEIWKL